MSKRKTELPALESAINAESWDWLCDNLPVLAQALQKEIENGASPEDVRFFIMKQTQREALAMRLEQAAKHLTAKKARA